MINKNGLMGVDGFYWWTGVVENRKDPLNLGRVQVRIFGWHTDNLKLIPSADLPWALPLLPVNESDTSKGAKEGQYIFGFFFDGPSGQFPCYFGVLPGIPNTSPNQSKGFSDQRKDLSSAPQPFGGQASLYPNILNEPTTSRLFRNENIDQTIIEREKKSAISGVPTASGTTWSQPVPSYNTVAPYNKVMETESGHVMEFDDTLNSERIHVAHRTGTYTEMRPDGTKVTRVVKDNYEIVSGDDFVNIIGTCNITVNGDVTLKVGGKVIASASEFDLTGDVNVTGNINATGDITDKTRAMSADRQIFDGHKHIGNLGSPTSPPLQSE